MYPILFSLGPLHIFSLSVFLILSWLAFSFLFWKFSRDSGVQEERSFDLMFFGTIAAFTGARVGYVLSHWDQFSEQLIKIPAIWVAPGYSFYGALLCGIGIMVILSRMYKLRIGMFLDIVACSLSIPIIIGSIGSFLDGSIVGQQMAYPWGVAYVGFTGFRHPVQLYGIIGYVAIYVCTLFLRPLSKRNKWPYGLLGLWFFMLFSMWQFFIEFFRQSDIYLSTLSIEQWILIALFCETAGGLFMKSKGRFYVQKFINRMKEYRFKKPNFSYETLTKRFTGRTKKEA